MKFYLKSKAVIYLTFVLCAVLLNSCEEEHPFGTKPNSVETLEVSDIQQITATVSGNIVSDGGRTLESRGICWNTDGNPTISNFKIANSSTSLGSYSCKLPNLNANTTYYARAYATNSAGTAYGKDVTFRTKPATLPIVASTAVVSNIKQTTATSGGTISSDGAAMITARGVCWNTTGNPTIGNPKTVNGTGIGTFSSPMTGLTPSTRYYVRAYATNSVGTAYGNEINFTTAALTIPVGVITNSITSITQTSASGGGSISEDGGAAITARGVCWSSTTSTPTISNSRTIDGSGIGTFLSTLSSLSPGTTYYVRAYATNSVGTAYGLAKSFTTVSATVPIGVTTTTISSISTTTASGGGSISGDGGSAITSRGVCWSTTSSPTISNSRTIDGSGTGTFSSSLSGLLPGTTYYVRAYATNSVGTTYGSARTFTTSNATPPTGVVTSSISSVTQTTASGGGSVSGDGGSAITSRGVCWSSTTSSPTISNSRTTDGSGIGTFSSSLSGLSPGTTYYVRAYATNSVGTTYGTARTFTTANLTIGQSYQGGIIAYIFQSGDSGYVAGETHGLIATSSNQSSGASWGCSGTSISTSISLGTGQNNTTAIVNGCSTSGIAARICNDLVTGGYSDWYLPSYNELGKLYSNRTSIGGFSSGSYWSSSQQSTTTAYGINFSTGAASNSSKNSALYVRAIRKF
ncbi:hypothetical protein FEDK69T_18720 [Flavobacterium enshiense DK69]|uniref:Fibronectin type-III domain-containing protein n=1 Tax=Flavobacterium enshiense DK69 TaxID=1107311 RepID=V6S7I4_9FLAO|nr:DUF1566 domain-containing protein [Flavobacterium enshiense]ESU22616.1 hypothetical protein FEDK69T_18720 [Flavobacterium enshiense DK69]KGO95670.1 hypothetical protein Q767_10660 [Flavobacterium enshiense DK69]